jgi:hypothetical protein
MMSRSPFHSLLLELSFLTAERHIDIRPLQRDSLFLITSITPGGCGRAVIIIIHYCIEHILYHAVTLYLVLAAFGFDDHYLKWYSRACAVRIYCAQMAYWHQRAANNE